MINVHLCCCINRFMESDWCAIECTIAIYYFIIIMELHEGFMEFHSWFVDLHNWLSELHMQFCSSINREHWQGTIIVRRAGLLWSQQDFEWRWSVPLFKCLIVLEFSFILFDLCLLITFFNFIMNYVPIVTFWIFTYHKICILSIMFCFIWSYWIIYFLACLEVSWRVVS